MTVQIDACTVDDFAEAKATLDHIAFMRDVLPPAMASDVEELCDWWERDVVKPHDETARAALVDAVNEYLEKWGF